MISRRSLFAGVLVPFVPVSKNPVVQSQPTITIRLEPLTAAAVMRTAKRLGTLSVVAVDKPTGGIHVWPIQMAGRENQGVIINPCSSPYQVEVALRFCQRCYDKWLAQQPVVKFYNINGMITLGPNDSVEFPNA